MKLTRNIAVVMAALVFGAVPAAAVAGNSGKSSGAPGHTKSTPASSTANSNKTTSSTTAYGKYCQTESKQVPTGQTGKSPFALCVTALAKADKTSRMTARAACKGLSNTHMKGTKGTPFSTCVSAVEKMRHNHS